MRTNVVKSFQIGLIWHEYFDKEYAYISKFNICVSCELTDCDRDYHLPLVTDFFRWVANISQFPDENASF